MRHFFPENAVSSAEVAKKWSKFDVFAPQIWGEATKFFFLGGGICKSTPLLTYRPSLVEIPWLVFHLC